MSAILSRMAGLAVATLVAACATTSPEESVTGADECMFAVSVRDWRPLDDENLILFETRRRAYHVELVRPAFGLRSDVTIGVYDRDGRICPYGGDAIIVDGGILDRIPIRSMRRVRDGELDALYVQFGIEPPVEIRTEGVELETDQPED